MTAAKRRAPLTTVVVDNEACGFSTKITVRRIGRDRVGIVLESDCESVTRWSEDLGRVDWRACLGGRPLDSHLWRSAVGTLPHRSCPVLTATLRAVETAVGLARPAGVSIRFVPNTDPPLGPKDEGHE